MRKCILFLEKMYIFASEITLMPENRNNYIAIAKALGIFLMVVGHSGCPTIICSFLYTFHMPLFFFFSGYFFKAIKNMDSYKEFCKRKVLGLYLPYLKWSIGFLIFHNFFCNVNIYNAITGSHPYQISDFIIQTIKAIFMTEYELLIRPFWFVKELLLSSICIATLSFFCNRFRPQIHIVFLLIILLIASIISKTTPHIPLIGDTSLLFFSMAYICSGSIFNKYEHNISVNNTFLAIVFIITLIGSMSLSSPIDMRYTTAKNIIPYYFFSVTGIYMIICISQKLDKSFLSNFLYYVGNHTMPILALNLLALKVGNLLKICIYDMPIVFLSSHPVISEHNYFFWIPYTIVGTSIPLTMHYIYNKYIHK